jgi:oligopeptide/dipeptide ABC transporter ATP-binding protein
VSDIVLSVENLRTYFHTEDGVVRAVDGLSFDLHAGETLGVVGESGCGKTIACLSILRLVEVPGVIEAGSRVLFRDRDLIQVPDKEMQKIRGNDISMVFQEPMTSLNPVYTIGNQISETIRAHQATNKRAARARAIEMLELVGIPDPAARVTDYPHEFSGGMRQRAMIAMALACEPGVVIADEPTTALDVTIQAEILDLLSDLQARLGMALIFVSHDLGVVSQIADRVLVMYAGQAVEGGTAAEVFERPSHPYTEGLLEALPRLGRRQPRLAVIPGSVPNPKSWPAGCRFHPRCPHAWDRCRDDAPPLIVAGRTCRCWLQDDPTRRASTGTTPLGEASP